MKISKSYKIMMLCLAPLYFAASAQDTLRITGTTYVNKGERLSIDAGKVILFEPGATLQVNGSLHLAGTAQMPVRIASANPSSPGIGILVSGMEESGTIDISFASFTNLLQPLHFDPFWYRKEVVISHTSISGSQSGEPVLYVSKPLLDIRGGKDIYFSLDEIRGYNNSGSILLEAAGADGIDYTINEMYLFENNIKGGEGTLGVLHLDCSSPVNAAKIHIRSIAFLRNFAGNKPVGLSVGGGLDNVKVARFYQDSNEPRLIYDREVNNRIPRVEVAETRDIGDWGREKDLVKGISHRHKGQVAVKIAGDPKLKELQDTLNMPVVSTMIRRGDSIVINYAEGDPKYLITTAGYRILIPPAPPEIATEPAPKPAEPALVKTDTTTKDSTLISIKFRIPTFGGKNKKITQLHTWELGGWFGGGIYCGGDYKHRYGPIFPSTIEYSGGVYGQYNLNDRFALRSTFYMTTISMHNSFAPGQFARMADVFSIDRNYKPIEVGWSYDHMFATKMQILELSGEWFMRSYMLANGKASKLVPALGFGAGVFHFTPYRYAYEDRQPGESFHHWKNRVYSNNRVNLRELGTEGQNFLPGAKKYSSIAASIHCSFSLNLIFKRWALKGEVKYVVTSTDYLDDFGPGLWYGGDYEKMYESAKKLNLYSDRVLSKTLPYDPAIAPNAPRSTNNLPDSYFQVHGGISYLLNGGKGKTH